MRINILRADPCKICSENKRSFLRTRICIKQRGRNIHNRMDLTVLSVEQRHSILNELFMRHQRSSGNLSNFVAERLSEGQRAILGRAGREQHHATHCVKSQICLRSKHIRLGTQWKELSTSSRTERPCRKTWLGFSLPSHAWFSAPCI